MKQETYDKWKSIIDSYDPSKETVKDYCLNNHINPKSYMRNIHTHILTSFLHSPTIRSYPQYTTYPTDL